MNAIAHITKQTALVATLRYCEEGLAINDNGYPAGAGWKLLRNLEGLAGEVKELQALEEERRRQGSDPHQGHRHRRDAVAARYDWHYWPGQDGWLVEHMASGTTCKLGDAILQ